jgi:hypothetical protein
MLKELGLLWMELVLVMGLILHACNLLLSRHRFAVGFIVGKTDVPVPLLTFSWKIGSGHMKQTILQ